jgi:hypothetical protein
LTFWGNEPSWYADHARPYAGVVIRVSGIGLMQDNNHRQGTKLPSFFTKPDTRITKPDLLLSE